MCNMQELWLQSELTMTRQSRTNNIKNKNLNYVCVVKPNDETPDTNDNVKTKTNSKHMKRDTWQVNVHVVFLSVRVVFASSYSLIAHHIAWLKLSECLSHLIHAWSERHSSTLSSPFHPTSFSLYSPSTSSSSCCLSTSTRISRNTVYSANKEMMSTDESYSDTGYEPKDYYLMETHVESLTEPLTKHQLPEQRFLEDVDYDDAALEEMHHNAHREHVYHSHREDLSVGQSSSSVPERTGRPVVERGQELNTEHAQIRTLLDRQREQILADCQAEIKRHEFQTNYDPRSVRKLSEIINLSRKNFIALKQRNFKDEIKNFSSCAVIAAKLGITWSSWLKVSVKWKNWRSFRVPL